MFRNRGVEFDLRHIPFCSLAILEHVFVYHLHGIPPVINPLQVAQGYLLEELATFRVELLFQRDEPFGIDHSFWVS